MQLSIASRIYSSQSSPVSAEGIIPSPSSLRLRFTVPCKLVTDDALEGGPQNGVAVGLLEEAAHVEIHVVHGAVELLQLGDELSGNHVAKVREALCPAGAGAADLAVSIVSYDAQRERERRYFCD